MGEKRGMKALELWCKRVTDGYQGVRVENMTTSWRDGLAFCAIIHHFRPDLIDFASLKKSDILHNNELAFRTAEVHLGIPALLDAEDMVEFSVPDRLSILTYLSQFYQTFAGSRQSTSPIHNRTPPVGKRSASPSVLSPGSQTPTKMVALAPARREPCAKCANPVFIAERLLVGRKLFHRTCFRCARCTHPLSLANCYETEDGGYCCEACPDEVDSKSGVRPESHDEYSQDFETVLESDPLPATQEIVVTEAKQDVAMSNFMIGQLQWEKEMSLPLPPSIVGEQDIDNHPQICTLDSETSSHETSAPVLLASDSRVKPSSVDISQEKNLYFFTKTNSPAAENFSVNAEQVPVIIRRSSIKNISDNDDQPSTASDRTEDCYNDQNELITKGTKDLGDELNSIVKLRKKMFDIDQQKENTPRKTYSSRTSITLTSKDYTEPEVSDSALSTKRTEEKSAECLQDEGVELSEKESFRAEDSKLLARKDQDLNFVADSMSSNDAGVSKGDSLDNLEIRQEFTNMESEEKIHIPAVFSDAVPSDGLLPSSASNETCNEPQKDEAIPNLDDEEDTVLESEKLNALVDIPDLHLEPEKETAPTPDKPSEQKSDDTTSHISSFEHSEKSSNRVSLKEDSIVYPTELNPFGDDESEDEGNAAEKPSASTNPFGEDDEEIPQAASTLKGKPPRPPPPRVLSKPAEENVPKINANPFWSDGEEPESEDESRATPKKLPVPLPRSIIKRVTPEPSPAPRLRSSSGARFGSANSLSSADSSNSTLRRKKKAAAPPPPIPDFTLLLPDDGPPPLPESAPPECNATLPDFSLLLPNTEARVGVTSPSHSISSSPKTLPRHRKARPAPPPPGKPGAPSEVPRRKIEVSPDVECEKSEKNEANLNRQSKTGSGEQTAFAIAANKSMYGQWKRKKGPAPPRPVPQRRQIREIPMKEVKRELQDIEVQQLELERQGVRLEKTIRCKFDDSEAADVEDSPSVVTPDVEDMVMQLFEIVNEKNELFRRQAELMYLRRQHRLEEEHADLEYEIRVSLERPEHTKTDSEKAYEEDLIRRLVDVVERRDEIVNCLEMDRQREAEEDRSIHEQLATFAAKYKGNEDQNISLNLECERKPEKSSSSKKSSTLKLLKKKVTKSKKKKEAVGADADKDVDELDNGKDKTNSKERTEKSPKTKRKWF